MLTQPLLGIGRSLVDRGDGCPCAGVSVLPNVDGACRKLHRFPHNSVTIKKPRTKAQSSIACPIMSGSPFEQTRQQSIMFDMLPLSIPYRPILSVLAALPDRVNFPCHHT